MLELHECPLCWSGGARFLHRSDDRIGVREFYECGECDLVFVPPEFHLPSEAEEERYLLHDNRPDDPAYRAFLGRLWDELRPRLRPGARGLDFGCGPGPALAHMMRESGFSVELYDLYFFPDPAPLARTYDFVTCTETFEHIRRPAELLYQLGSLLEPGGRLGVMTGMLDDRAQFADWGYQRDPTHIAFFSVYTMRWIARKMRWSADFPAPNIAIFRVPDSDI